MIDDDSNAARQQAEGSTDADPVDPHATRVPSPDEAFATRLETLSTTWQDPFGSILASGPVPPGATRFRIIRPHARGALGEVFLAHDEELQREVALKEIQERHAEDPRSRIRFLLEAAVTGGLEHPGIVPVYGLGHYPDGRPYYAMRFIRGETFKEAVDRHHGADASTLDSNEQSSRLRVLLGRFVDICNAIAYAHSRGIIHRDLKPANVMLGPYGETLVVDWGLAKSLSRPDDLGCHEGPLKPAYSDSSATVAGSVIGTPAFMSPEQAAGDVDRLGLASDIYSLGATLYYVLTGRPSLDGSDIVEILAKVQKGDFLPPRKVRPDIPKALQAICLKAMATRPEDRYPTVQALAADIEHWLTGASVSAYPDPLWVRVSRLCRRLWHWGWRRPVLASGALAIVFFDLTVLIQLLLVYVQAVLHTSAAPRLNVAAGVILLLPFVAQVGALVGSFVGAAVGGAMRRTLSAIRRGVSVGLKFGIPVAVVAWLMIGSLGVARATRITAFLFPVFSPQLSVDWPRLPDAIIRKPEWVKPDAPLDIDGFFEQRPKEENAAPVYLDAMLEFDDGMASCFSPDEGKRRGAIALVLKERRIRLEKSSRPVPSEEVDLFLQDYEFGFLRLRQAQRRPECRFRGGLGIDARWPHSQAAREIARVAVLKVRHELDRGELDRAIDDFQMVLRLARDLRPRAGLVIQEASLDVEDIAENQILLPILGQPGLKLEQCDRLQAILARHSREGVSPFVEGFQAEYFDVGQTVRDFLEQRVNQEQLGGSRARRLLRSLRATSNARSRSITSNAKSGTDTEALARLEDALAASDAKLAKMSSRRFAESTQLAYDEFHRAMLELDELPLLRRIDAASKLPPKVFADHPLLFVFSPAIGEFLKSLGRAEATRDAMKCLVALRRWEVSGKAITPGLKLAGVMKDAGLTSVPADPFDPSGGPLRLVFHQGEAIIYSVGLDGIDHGGKLDSELGARFQGDCLYRLKMAEPPR